MSFARAHAARIAVATALVLSAAACGDTPPLAPLPQLDTSAYEPSVRNALNTARATLDRLAAGRPSNVRLGDAYGELAMTYHAQDLVAPASVAYTNARRLAPGNKRWAYLQGHLYNDAARVKEALEAFEAAFKLDDRDPATLQSLGQVYLQNGELERARAMFERLGENRKARAVAAAGLGKVAMATRDYKSAIANFEEALRLSPGSTRLRQSLAVAYQATGDRTKAEENTRQHAVDGAEPAVDDPAADALADKVAASKVLLRRGQRAGKTGRFDLAEKAFRAAVAADPGNAEAIANLGISLANLDRLEEAQVLLEQALKMDDTIAVAHLSLGVLHDRQGRDDAAIAQYEATLKHDAGNMQAYVYLGDALMRSGKPLQAAARYREALQRAPESARMRYSLAIAYVKGGGFGDARKVLEDGLAAQPNHQVFTNALARVLATAPDAKVRNGARALEMAKKLFEAARVPEVGQTYAMALAEVGRFDEAVKLQQETIIAITRAGAKAPGEFVVDNLARYRQRQPARNGWAADDLVFTPRSPAAARRPA